MKELELWQKPRGTMHAGRVFRRDGKPEPLGTKAGRLYSILHAAMPGDIGAKPLDSMIATTCISTVVSELRKGLALRPELGLEVTVRRVGRKHFYGIGRVPNGTDTAEQGVEQRGP